KTYEKDLAAAEHPKVKQDIQILIKSVEDSMETDRLTSEVMLPYHNVTQLVFFGIRSLMDPQVAEERRHAAIERIKKYAGIANGYKPITELARADTERVMRNKGLIGPFIGEVEKDLENAPKFIAGVRQLLASSALEGWEEPYDTLAKQLEDYNAWVAEEVKKRARPTSTLPREIYENNLKNWGVDASPEELIRQAQTAFAEIRAEMEALAPLVAKEKGYDVTDYRDVILKLREEEIPGDKVLAEYEATLGKIEEIIEREGIVTLPEREAGIEIASAAETAAQPAPHVRPPRLVGNTGEYPVFVLPKIEQREDGSWGNNEDNFMANTWTLTAHEARPGHELQFSAMIEGGVSTARALFSFNSANVEGWGLYAETITKPYMPLDGQLISLQLRLLRAARMFLDPLINTGQLTPAEAKQFLMQEVVITDGFAQQEVDRYAFRLPGQATSYYYGYAKMRGLRIFTELKLRDKFDQKAFHDFVLAQGLLPPELLRKAVEEEFIPQYAG
ncbi:MAG: DUF885 domain-containing protein, partial [Pseudomonadota bacterium]